MWRNIVRGSAHRKRTNMVHLITTTSELADVCKRLAGDEFITIDTEFLREKTYYPKLCLVQLASGADEELAVAVDPLADGIDLAPMYDLLRNESVLKVIHAGGQDMEIFAADMEGDLPKPVFDTQIAGAVCGMGEQIGYENIVSRLLKRQIDKSQQFTDWSKRPLTDEQLTYAIADVTHLRDVYHKLVAQCTASERLHWVQEEAERVLLNPETYKSEPKDAWVRLKKRVKKQAALRRLQALCQWREERAIRENKPRGWILHDDGIVEIAMTNPTTHEKMNRIRAIGRHRGGLKFEDIFEVLERANQSDAQIVLPDSGKSPTSSDDDMVREFLKLVLKQQCEEHQIASRLVATIDDINQLLATGDARFMHGWRYDVFGSVAKAAMKGELSLSLNQKSLAFGTSKMD